MSTRRRIVLCGIAASVGAGIGIASMTVAAAKDPPLTLTARATAINDFVDVGPGGPSPGDIYVFVEDLFDTRDVRVGTAEGRCNLIDPARGHFECTTVNLLADGTITTAGVLVNVPGATSTGSITGGTGRYVGAQGEASLDLGGPVGPHEIVFRFTT
jgi:hypothetical protein